MDPETLSGVASVQDALRPSKRPTSGTDGVEGLCTPKELRFRDFPGARLTGSNPDVDVSVRPAPVPPHPPQPVRPESDRPTKGRGGECGPTPPQSDHTLRSPDSRPRPHSEAEGLEPRGVREGASGPTTDREQWDLFNYCVPTCKRVHKSPTP